MEIQVAHIVVIGVIRILVVTIIMIMVIVLSCTRGGHPAL